MAEEDTQAIVPYGFWRFPLSLAQSAFQLGTRLVEDTVPTMVSFMDSSSLLAAAVVCHGWRKIASRDDFWTTILRVEFAIEVDSLEPAPKPLKRLWIQMRRTFRSLLMSA